MKRLLVLGGVLLIAAAVAGAADEPSGVRPLGSELIPGKGLQKLDLTKDQTAPYEKLAQEYRDKHKESHAKFCEAFNTGDLNKIKEAGAAQSKLRADYMAKVEALLTDAQKKTLAGLLKEYPPPVYRIIFPDEKPEEQPKDPAAREKLGRIPTSLAYSHDGKLLAAGAVDYKIRLYDAASGKELRALPGHERRYPIVKNGDDNNYVLGAPIGAELPSKLKVKNEWFAAADYVQSLAFSPDDHILATGACDHKVRLWDVASGKETKVLDVPYAMVRGLVFSPDGKYLASRGHDQGIVQIWDVATGKVLHTIDKLHRGSTWKGPFPALAFSPDSKLLAVGDFGVLLYDTATGQLKQRLGEQPKEEKGEPHPDREMTACRAVTFSPDGKLLAAAASRLNQQGIWDVATGKHLRPLLLPKKEPIADLAFSPDGKTVVAAVAEDYVQLFDPMTGKHITALDGSSSPFRLACAPDGKTIAALMLDKKNKGAIHRWTMEDRKKIGSFGDK